MLGIETAKLFHLLVLNCLKLALDVSFLHFNSKFGKFLGEPFILLLFALIQIYLVRLWLIDQLLLCLDVVLVLRSESALAKTFPAANVTDYLTLVDREYPSVS